ncbi:MAG: hypothetical protein J6J33_00695 [Clostridia bacterium]|nr:hypothetical protein [Clostridia bacterium]
MYKSKLAIFIDSLACSVISLLLIYSWLNKFIKNAFLSLFIANIISIIIFSLIFLHFLRNHTLTKANTKENKLFENSLNKILFSPKDFQINYFCKLLNCTYINEKFFLNDKFYFFISINSPLSNNDFFEINNFNLSNKLSKPMIIISLDADEKFINLLNTSPIKYTLFLKEDLFNIMKLNDGFVIVDYKSQQPHSLFNKIKLRAKSLSKVKFRNLFFSGASLIIFSFFIPYSYLYLVIGSLLLTFSFISLFSKNTPKISQTEISVNDLIKK